MHSELKCAILYAVFWEVPGIKNGILEVITTEVICLANKLLDQVEDVKSPTYSHVGSFMVILRDRVIYTCHPCGQGHLYLSSFWTGSFIPVILMDRVIYTCHPYGQGHLYLSSLWTGSFIPVILMDRVIYTCHPLELLSFSSGGIFFYSFEVSYKYK